jgi:RNA polymerase sigma-70 factor (ECF subfamily)
LLQERQPTPVVLINRAIALAQVKGPAAGLDALKMIPADTSLQRYPFLLIAEGEFHLRLGHLGEEHSASVELRNSPERSLNSVSSSEN